MSTDPPQPTVGDAAHTAARAVLSVVPVIGGPAVELFNWVIQPPIERRRDAWCQMVGEKLLELERHGLNVADLQHNEQFVTAVIQATAAAIRTHSEEKRVKLRNALANIASGQSPDETVQHMLLMFIDELTETHLRLLAFADCPKLPEGEERGRFGGVNRLGGLGEAVEEAIPTLKGQRELYDQLWKDLSNRGLVDDVSLHTTMSGSGRAQSRTTPLGKMLLRFVSDPK